jgi:hypothetical protein
MGTTMRMRFQGRPGMPETPLASGNDFSGVLSLAFRDQQHGVAVGGDYRSYDNGETWQWLDSVNSIARQIGKLGSLPAGPEAATRVSR